MTRPALIIGIGGTGQWVLTYLKKDLMESNNGEMPDNVRLLCLDTMPQAAAEIAATSVGREEEEVKVGSIQLERDTEFVHLGGDVYELSQLVCKDSEKEGDKRSLPHVASWFQACHWLANLPRASFVLAAGAGQLRQFGRIALFKDLSSVIQSQVWRRLDVAVGQLAKKLNGQRLEIIIVGSFAGGTGSGLFIDMGLLARHRARNVPVLIRGYFVLPRAFDPDASDDMLARSFAAWRELNRFMVVSQDFALPNMVYNSLEQALQIDQVRTKVYDACYLIDGIRGGARVAAEAELGVFPTVADAISAILDETSGGKYTEWVVQNLAPTYATMPGEALYSVLGTHTFKVPVYYAQQDFTHRFTVSWLDELLKPIRDDPQNRERVTRIDATSPYDPTKTGREEALSLLTSPQQYRDPSEEQERSEVPTLFFNHIADVVMEGGANNINMIRQYARGSWGGRAWLDIFANLGDRLDIAEVREQVQRAAKLKISSVVKTSKMLKEPPRNFPRRVERDLPTFVRTNYGFRTAGGEENRGKFGDALDECGQAQMDIFSRMVELWLLRSLMSGDKSGRLGYAYDLLDGLVTHLGEFLDFMDKVRAKREELQPHLKAREDRERKKRMMIRYSTRKWPAFLPLFNHPKADQSQRVYLKAEQAVVDARKDEILHSSVTQTARAMQDYSATVRDELGRWIRLLATGDPATGVEGLYSTLRKQRRAIDKTRKADERLVAVQTRLGDLHYPQQQEKEELNRLMEGVEWEIESSDPFRLQLSIAPTGEIPVALELPTGQERAEKRQRLTQRNLRDLQSYAHRRFSELPEETKVAERLRQEFTPDTLAEEIGSRAEPLFAKAEGVEGGPAKWSELIRISTQEVDEATRAFIQGQIDSEGNVVASGIVQARRKKRGLDANVRDQDQLVEAVGSSDPHKCTVVRTDDLLSVEHFRSWHECREAYLRNRERMQPHLNHIFPAEANAARYEMNLAQKRRWKYRVFHPWVVMLLEYPKRLEQFFLCWALDWMQIRDDGALSWYELNVPGFDEPFMLTPKSETLWSTFQAARFFVLEGRDQKPMSNWSLDYNLVQRQIEAQERSRGADEWLSFLRGQVEKSEVVEIEADDVEADAEAEKASEEIAVVVCDDLTDHIQELDELRAQAKKMPAGEPADYHQAYKDLSDVAALMFEERIERKEVQLGRRSRR